MDAKENLNFDNNLSKKINDAEIKEMKYKGNIFLKLFKSKNYGRFFCKIIISLMFFSSGWFCFFVNSKESNPKDMLLVESEDEEEVSSLMNYAGVYKKDRGSVKKSKKGANKGRKRKIKESSENIPVLLNKTKNSKKNVAENNKIKQKTPFKNSSKKSKKLTNENFSKNEKKNLKETKKRNETKSRKIKKPSKKNEYENYNINNEETFKKKPKNAKLKKQKKSKIKKTIEEKSFKKLGTKRKKVSPRKNRTTNELKKLLRKLKRKKHLKFPKKLNKIKDFPKEKNERIKRLVEVLKNIFARKKILRKEEFLKKFGEVSLDFALKKPCNLSFNSNDGEDDFNNDSISCLNEDLEMFNRFEDFKEEPSLSFENKKMVVFKNGLNFEFNYDFNGDWLKLINPKNGRNFFVRLNKDILNKLFEKKKVGELSVGDGTIVKNNYLSESYDSVNLKYEIDENVLNIENCNSGFKLSFNLNGEAKKAIEKFFSQDFVEDELFDEESFENLNRIENEKKLELISDEKNEKAEEIIEGKEETQNNAEKENLNKEENDVLNFKFCNSKIYEEMLKNFKDGVFNKALRFVVREI